MILGEIIATASALIIVGLAMLYIVKAKKSGQKCIGCPYSKTCSSGTCSCTCSKDGKNEEKSNV